MKAWTPCALVENEDPDSCRSPNIGELTLNEQPVLAVTNFCYLGSILRPTSDSNAHDDLNWSITIAPRCLECKIDGVYRSSGVWKCMRGRPPIYLTESKISWLRTNTYWGTWSCTRLRTVDDVRKGHNRLRESMMMMMMMCGIKSFDVFFLGFALSLSWFNVEIGL